MQPANVPRPYIIWTDSGYEGWSPESYSTFDEAASALITAPYYGNARVLTQVIPVVVVPARVVRADDGGEGS